MATSGRPPKNNFVRHARKVYNPLGFSKGYNFVLWFIFGGAFFGFVLARIQYLNVSGIFCGPATEASHAALGECFYYENYDVAKVGIRMHLGMILPASFLAVFQFVPAIRHKLILFHRMNGYVVVIMSLISNLGVLMIARHAFGGTIATQGFAGSLVVATTIGLSLAYYNVKTLQLDQHRAWMLRTWVYYGSIVTMRFIMIFSAMIISGVGEYYFVEPCDKLASIFNDTETLHSLYPSCDPFISGADLAARSIVKADINGDSGQMMASLNMSFGMAAWLAFAIHAVAVEVYLQLTPRESERLRQVSYQRQLEAGFKNPGNTGLTVQRLGDANEWVPAAAPREKAAQHQQQQLQLQQQQEQQPQHGSSLVIGGEGEGEEVMKGHAVKPYFVQKYSETSIDA